MKFARITFALFVTATAATSAPADEINLKSVLGQSDAAIDPAVKTILRKYQDLGFTVATRCLDHALPLAKDGKPDPSAVNCRNDNLLIQRQTTASDADIRITAIVQAQDQSTVDAKSFLALHCTAGSLGVTFAEAQPSALAQAAATLRYHINSGPIQQVAVDAASKGGYGLFTVKGAAAERWLEELHIGAEDVLFVGIDAPDVQDVHFRIRNFAEAVADFQDVCARLEKTGP